MELAKIIEELVEKRLNDCIRVIVDGDQEGRTDRGELGMALKKKVKDLIQVEIANREDEIRRSVIMRLSAAILKQDVRVNVTVADWL